MQLNEDELDSRLYPPSLSMMRADKQIPNWNEIHQELRKKSVTMQLLWLEYKSANPRGYQYTQFCHHYSVWRKKIDLPFRNNHLAGEKLFIDYAGQTIPIYGPDGSVRHAQIFIGVLGASNYTFAEASWTQTLPDWISSHNRMFSFLGGCPEILVPDNLRSAVQRACRYEPLINPTYLEMARHYRTAVIPARKKKPKDKAKAEQGVLLVERWILAALRNRKFFSLEELNHAIRELLERLNTRPFQKLAGNRRSAFLSIDKPALKALPAAAFQMCEFKIGTVNINYHFEIDRHHYSVPYQYVQK
jgi:transposase